ncbi:11298_t:CDS:2 [Funneliformis geosporum]|uniref:11298_t:CDS:1 n=1 Tax=Funneliformis geosporum TaxID=1117311 RepID=A0A9W4X5W2_9GLOM|nr:11298_t:CDS:2 [Funneliformis geosporum]
MISAQEPKFPLHTVKLPPKTFWLKCAKYPKMASYAIQLASPKAAVDPSSYGGEYYNLKATKVTAQEKYGFIAVVANGTYYVVGSLCGNVSTDEITALSTICAWQGPINWPGTWCLAIFNVLNFSQNVDVVLSFTQSVFIDGTYRKDDEETVPTIVTDVAIP